jgi:hypothetical protein
LSYVLNAFIADVGLLRQAKLPVALLEQGKGLVPLDAAFWRELAGRSQPLLARRALGTADAGEFDDESERATLMAHAAASFDRLAAVAQRLSMVGSVTYLESEYWAGSGLEASAVWRSGALVAPPLFAVDAVNQALRTIGVSSDSTDDEFTALGLGRFRSTEMWRGAAMVLPEP